MGTAITQTPLAHPPVGGARLPVLHAVDKYWLEQTQTWLYQQVRNLPTSVESHVVCEHTRNLDQFQVPNIHCLAEAPVWRARVDLAARKLRLRRHLGLVERVARKHRVRVLHSHFGPVGWEHCRMARRMGLGHVVTFYGLDVNYLPRHGWADKYLDLFANIDLVLCEGPHMAGCIVALGCPAERVRVHHLGVDVSSIGFRPRHWTPGGPLRVLIAASFREKKGVPYAMEALGMVGRKMAIEVTVIGDAGTDEGTLGEKRRILEIMREYGMESRVRLLGFQPHRVLMEEAATHHVFLSPSVTAASGDTEGGAPVTIIEMAAAGIGIVSTTHCDIPEVVLDGQTGLLAPERDAGALAGLIERMAGLGPAVVPMLEAGRRRIEELFDARRQGEALAGHYRGLVKG